MMRLRELLPHFPFDVEIAARAAAEAPLELEGLEETGRCGAWYILPLLPPVFVGVLIGATTPGWGYTQGVLDLDEVSLVEVKQDEEALLTQALIQVEALDQAPIHLKQLAAFCREQGISLPSTWPDKESMRCDSTVIPGSVEGLVRVLSTEAVKRYFPRLKSSYMGKDLTRAEVSEFENFLIELFWELVDTLCDPEKLAPILAEAAVVGPALYFCWQMIKRLREFSETRENRLASQIARRCARILHYFEVVPRSRISEISIATGIPRDEAKLFLHLMRFVHESNCFWHPPAMPPG